jgi:hypothetical protein
MFSATPSTQVGFGLRILWAFASRACANFSSCTRTPCSAILLPRYNRLTQTGPKAAISLWGRQTQAEGAVLRKAQGRERSRTAATVRRVATQEYGARDGNERER